MAQSSEYIGVLVTFILALTIAGLIIFLNKILGPKNKGSAVKSEPFECGVDPLAQPKTGHFSVKFYLIAMLFILFDVEIVGELETQRRVINLFLFYFGNELAGR